MKLLDQSFRKNGFNFLQVKRVGDVAIYRKANAVFILGYEVFRIQRHNGRRIGDAEIPPAEFMPSSEQWGTLGFTCMTLDAAEARFMDMLNTEKKEK